MESKKESALDFGNQTLGRSDLLKRHAKLENEPKLFTRSEVLKFMANAVTLCELYGKRPKDSELEDLLP